MVIVHKVARNKILATLKSEKTENRPFFKKSSQKYQPLGFNKNSKNGRM